MSLTVEQIAHSHAAEMESLIKVKNVLTATQTTAMGAETTALCQDAVTAYLTWAKNATTETTPMATAAKAIAPLLALNHPANPAVVMASWTKAKSVTMETTSTVMDAMPTVHFRSAAMALSRKAKNVT